MSVSLLTFASLLFTISYGIDRTEFSNFRATESHDSYLSFSSSLSFPLSLQWNRSDISCTFNNPLINFAFANDTFFCITNEIWDLNRNINSSIVAFSADTGSILWKTEIYSDPTTLTSFDGLVYINGGYISVLDDNYGNLYILNSLNGKMEQNVSIKDDCPDNLPNGQYCIQSGVASSNSYKSSLAYFTTYDDHSKGTLFQLDINGKSNSIQVGQQTADSAQEPTICNDDVVITSNLFDTVNAFNLSNNLEALWNYTVTNQYGEVYDNPPLCIPRSDGGFNVLVNSIFEDEVLESWELLDGSTGKLLQTITWQIASSGIPAINSDKMILVRSSGGTSYGYDISDMNGNWTEIWKNTSNTYYDLMIVDEYVFMSNAVQVDVFQISDGKEVFSWTFPVDAGGPFIVSRLSAGTDKNGKPMVIILAINSFVPTVQSTLFSLQ